MKFLKSNPFLALANNYMIDAPEPSNISYFWNFGSLLACVLVVQIVTGILLACFYVASMDLAFASVERIGRDVNYGFLLRALHANGASFFFIFLYLHIGRGLYYGSYRAPRTMTWNIGVIIFLLTIITAFLGYCLPANQMSFWGATVITNLLSAVPFIGDDLVQLLWGGFSVSNPTLNRFFSLHYLMPFVIAALSIMHLIALHTNGSSNPLGVTANMDRLPMNPYFLIKDLITIFIFLLAINYMVFYNPYGFMEPDCALPADPLKTPMSIVPEWYLLPYYAILRAIPNFQLGVVAMLLSILVLLLLPLLDFSAIRGNQFNPMGKFFFWCFVADFCILAWIGGSHPENVFITIGAYATAFYFIYFFILIPVYTILGNTLIDLGLPRSNK
uniref:Cytochrome b n=1 Tax=Schizosaccharomyces octosporus TaxID=4899 RepID=CYB_SCHOT|nr:apocytochrome b [Schizosaccharomyces octosporus]Q8HQ92.1 RecName: Full=Cytochrome b; AltName: Full=Complex III subunit 3; AltName: Full=Complex III subunit III; AltName: Full=Cytochrome b-c1 complex subunit 3; AltName: Full=Ubiquinol-cytochrome-c reductase complex cytochrome b subunit [Schizosaccharomyces octosporus]AAN31937.1 apocytochrome b [Schizosaccharomyces octosporus]